MRVIARFVITVISLSSMVSPMFFALPVNAASEVVPDPWLRTDVTGGPSEGIVVAPAPVVSVVLPKNEQSCGNFIDQDDGVVQGQVRINLNQPAPCFQISGVTSTQPEAHIMSVGLAVVPDTILVQKMLSPVQFIADKGSAMPTTADMALLPNAEVAIMSEKSTFSLRVQRVLQASGSFAFRESETALVLRC